MRTFKGASTNRRIFRAAASVTVAGIVVKVAATFKEIVVARAYGRSDEMDAFLAAMLIPALLINLISESMNQALVPTLIRVKEREGQKRAQELLSNSMLWMCMLLALATVIMALTARGFFPLIASHFSPAKLDLSVRIFYALLPVVLITGIATNCTAVLNAFDRFALPALVVVINPSAIILGALLLSARLGIWAVVYATLAGALIHAGVVAGMMESRGFRFRLRWHGMTEATREVAFQYGPVLLSALVASGGLLVDQSMAAMLPAGSVSALVYANRFVSVILTLLAGAVSTAVMPYFSRMIAFEDWAGCRHTLRTWVRLTALVSAPIAIAHDRRLAPADPDYASTRGIRAAGHCRGHAGAGHVRHSDSVLRHQPGLLPLSGCHAPHRPHLLLRRHQSGSRRCVQPDSDALVRRSRNRARHFPMDRQHVLVSLVLDMEAAAADNFGTIVGLELAQINPSGSSVRAWDCFEAGRSKALPSGPEPRRG